ncbi:GAP family protein [Mycobacterium barrassiae]|uniref:GAP family protein n=1 Tax=Mycobacterium barrassiae TaxID=319709 RepID=UPI002265CA00|nr:GAP family protein [Mycobacterium barrassiae]MCV7300313.1 GAP family protein [Mycobacterium barrassiae]
MWSVLSQLLAPAMVVAVSPFSIIVAIFLVLHTDRAQANGWAFLAGRLLALAAVTVAVLQAPRLIGSLNRPASPGVFIVLGVVLVLIGVWVWLRRDRMTEEPAWLARLDRLSPVGAAAIGILLVVSNPKMLAATAAAGLLIGTAGVGIAGAGGAVVYYSAVASSTVAVPVLAYAAVGARTHEQLSRFKKWLHHHNGHVTAVILLAAGIALLFTGIIGL